ncbi:transketolase family protein [Clostridium grantii]|uniref:Transketolase n=1 Tax=Clostridium grantii DSM 8605 TaxID=1121316 RepID=A0A1M5UB70_9CLOT|nr:transketolase C-terminal domain-containing protein [Clostridium grantii]SHH59933.1 transketolase [Clostridium grantii DSM 8605]
MIITESTRQAFGDELLVLGEEVDNLYVIDADVGKSMKTVPFQQKFPEKHVNVGIAEQNCAGVAAGLATMGKLPIISTYAVFGSMRMLEQIRQSICYTKLNVKIACSHGGLTPANDGGSHQGIEDMGILRTIPGMTVMMGADYNSTRKLLREMVKSHVGPAYIRFTREATPGIYDEDERFEIGVAKQLREGNDVTIIAVGDVLILALKAAKILEEKGIKARVLDMHTIKPLDQGAVLKALRETKGIITVEDHNIINGLGSAVSEVVCENNGGIVYRIGILDKFGESGPYEVLLKENGISVDNIIAKAEKIVKGE